ncbi:gene transfer agent family protein [Paracoccus pantotrophus]|uniref:gene transfer agent family protein n=1 Tax=Paracoccus pantotrophus TaxID=82367 RepID=UPI000E0951EE|nr:gene transfer agent family protein [Paracoccus pantotrophus]RDD95559.1 gene transfer agent family protein [Paracoccus pantotrophus]
MRFPWQARARSASSPSEPVNPLAGEVEIWLDGRRHVARLTLGALAGLEAELGAESMIALVERFEGGRPVNVTFNVSTPDVAGFQRSQSQIAAQMARLLARGERNG